MLAVLLLLLAVWAVWSAATAKLPQRTSPLLREPVPPRKQGGTSGRATAKAPPVDLDTLPAEVRRLIEGLPRRSMDELQRQWLNAVRAIDRLGSENAAAQIAFRDAVTAEWGKRATEATRDPDHFAWPSTVASGGTGMLTGGDWHLIGMLSYLGYRVGASQGEKPGVRRQILDMCFDCDLPPINGPSYLAQWGARGTAARLKKLSHELASFARNAKRKRSANLSVAIDDWEEDLSYLYSTYYVRRFHFAWPDVELSRQPIQRRRRW